MEISFRLMTHPFRLATGWHIPSDQQHIPSDSRKIPSDCWRRPLVFFFRIGERIKRFRRDISKDSCLDPRGLLNSKGNDSLMAAKRKPGTPRVLGLIKDILIVIIISSPLITLPTELDHPPRYRIQIYFISNRNPKRADRFSPSPLGFQSPPIVTTLRIRFCALSRRIPYWKDVFWAWQIDS